MAFGGIGEFLFKPERCQSADVALTVEHDRELPHAAVDPAAAFLVGLRGFVQPGDRVAGDLETLAELHEMGSVDVAGHELRFELFVIKLLRLGLRVEAFELAGDLAHALHRGV
jgi:hypothetical protein